MITAALNTVAVSPRHHAPSDETPAALARIAAEIAERLDEMNAEKLGSGADLISRLACVARIDRGAFNLVISVLHGDVASLLDSYAVRGDRAGREKQTMHYRIVTEIDAIRPVFPDVAAHLDRIRLSVAHHEDPLSRQDVLREAQE